MGLTNVVIEFQKAAEINTERRLVFGWASVVATVEGTEIVDAHDHVIEPSELEEAVYMFVRCGGMASDAHEYMWAGMLVESIVFTPEKLAALGLAAGSLPVGWWVGFYISDDIVWNKVKTGEYKMFSIGGKAILEPIEVAESDSH